MPALRSECSGKFSKPVGPLRQCYLRDDAWGIGQAALLLPSEMFNHSLACVPLLVEHSGLPLAKGNVVLEALRLINQAYKVAPASLTHLEQGL